MSLFNLWVEYRVLRLISFHYNDARWKELSHIHPNAMVPCIYSTRCSLHVRSPKTPEVSLCLTGGEASASALQRCASSNATS